MLLVLEVFFIVESVVASWRKLGLIGEVVGKVVVGNNDVWHLK
jgi:hypothetical protein